MGHRLLDGGYRLGARHLLTPPSAALPMELAERHWSSVPGDVVTLSLPDVERSWVSFLCEGAGFSVSSVRGSRVRARRVLTLPDTVGLGMRLLVCGLNPSVYSAERGVGYARPGNRFWPAALEAGIVTRALDGRHALQVDGVGITDLVKRATVAASELSRDEYRAGVARLTRLVEWLRPGAVCFVGLAGWRAAVDPKAVAGPVAAGFAGAAAYVMPSTSGLNARTSLPELVGHLRSALTHSTPTPESLSVFDRPSRGGQRPKGRARSGQLR